MWWILLFVWGFFFFFLSYTFSLLTVYFSNQQVNLSESKIWVQTLVVTLNLSKFRTLLLVHSFGQSTCVLVNYYEMVVFLIYGELCLSLMPFVDRMFSKAAESDIFQYFSPI